MSSNVARLLAQPFAEIYDCYVAKVERKGGTVAEVDRVITWLTGLDQAGLQRRLQNRTTCREFFESAEFHPNASKITGTICGVKVETVSDPLMKRIRMLDKLVDEVAKRRPMEKILRA